MSIGLARACQGKRKDVGELVEGHLRSRCQLFRRRNVAPLMSIINRTQQSSIINRTQPSDNLVDVE